jgi:hypothetical protein
MPRRLNFTTLKKREELGSSTHLIELRHQSRLAAGGVVPMNDVLAGNSIEHAQGVADCERGGLLIAPPNRNFSLLHVCAGRRNVRPVAQAPAFGNANALLCGFGIRQLENPLAVWLQIITHTTNYGVCAALRRWYQKEQFSTTIAGPPAV